MTENADSQLPDFNPEPMPDTHAGIVVKYADAMLRGALWWGVGTAVAAVVVSTVLVGVPGLVGSLIGVAIALGSSLLTLIVMRRSSGVQPTMLLGIAMSTFIGKLILLFGLAKLLHGVAFVHPKAFALSFAAVIVVWTVAETFAFRKVKVPTVIPSP